jgi:hypothetical protein
VQNAVNAICVCCSNGHQRRGHSSITFAATIYITFVVRINNCSIRSVVVIFTSTIDITIVGRFNNYSISSIAIIFTSIVDIAIVMRINTGSSSSRNNGGSTVGSS